jgi:hypothetical protein
MKTTMKVTPDYIEKSLVLSTGHIKEETCRKLEKELVPCTKNHPFRTSNHFYGVIIFICLKNDEGDLEQETEWLKENDMAELIPILVFAREHDCTMINFDSDAGQCKGLKIFKW